MRLRLPDRGAGSGERGAIAVLVALLMVVVFAMAAIGVDITSQVNQHQKLYDTIDAAAHAGAYRLPSAGTTARSDALANALKNDPDLTGALAPTVNLLCIVASKLQSGTTYIVDNTQIPATCNPVAAGGSYTGYRCNTTICSIPCDGASDVCNTVKVSDSKVVPFAFAPVIGIKQGVTGTVTSAACKGPCGTTPPNPMDVAVVADRTASMAPADITAMVGGIKGMLQTMTPSQQYVALGTIGRSKLSPASATCSGTTLKARSQPAAAASPPGPTVTAAMATTGPWLPEAFSNDYLTTGTTNINASSTLINGIECLKNQNNGTALAAPMKAASRLLLGLSTSPETVNNIGSLPARTGTARKAIIFETDGEPYEYLTTTGGSPVLTVNNDIFSSWSSIMTVPGSPTKYYYHGGDVACQNLLDVAANAKAAGILVVTVGFNLSGRNCDTPGTGDKAEDPDDHDCRSVGQVCNFIRYDSTPKLVMDVLSAAASPSASGVASAANSDCSTTLQRTAENTDGDYFFCAAAGSTSTDMAAIFKTAFNQLATGIRLIALP